MRIGFDFDKVFVDYPPLVPDKLVNYFYRYGFHFRTKKTNKLSYRIPSLFEEKMRLLTHFEFLRPAIKKNVSILRKISRGNTNNVYLVSGRFGFLKNKTEQLIVKNKLQSFFDGIYFNFENEQPHLFKERVLRKHNIEAYIDDDLELLRYLSLQLPKVSFFWITQQQTPIRRKNIFRIRDLSDFYTWYKKQ